MYNRYIRNDRGTYTRIPEAESPPSEPQHAKHHASSPPYHNAQQAEHAQHACTAPAPEATGGISHTLRRLLDRFHLDSVDSGDLLLLLLLFLLFREDADEELLFALGLLLIL